MTIDELIAALEVTWKPVHGFEGLYEVSSDGRVRRDPASGYCYELNVGPPPSRPNDYPAVSLHGRAGRQRRTIHRMVAEAFICTRPSPDHEVCHKDGNPRNNRVGNLYWGTRRDNARDRDRHGRTARGPSHGMHGRGLHGEANGCCKLSDGDVVRIFEMAGKESQRAIARRFSITQGVVWRIINGKSRIAALKARRNA